MGRKQTTPEALPQAGGLVLLLSPDLEAAYRAAVLGLDGSLDGAVHAGRRLGAGDAL